MRKRIPPQMRAPMEGEGKKKPAKRRRRCANDGVFFVPKTRWQKFCSSECKNEFHRHGSAFGPLKDRLEKLVKERARDLTAAVIQAEVQTATQELRETVGWLKLELSNLRTKVDRILRAAR